MTVFWSLMIPFLGTSLGAACVFLVKKDLKPLVQKGFLGFASGVMVAASVWSLLIPAMEMSQRMKKFAFVPAAAGFLLGIGFLLFMDRAVPHLHMGSEKAEGPKVQLKKRQCLSLQSRFTIFGGSVCWRCVCRRAVGKRKCDNGRCYCALRGNCHTEFS